MINFVLFRIDFDNMENGAAEATIKNVVAVFTQKSLLDAFVAARQPDSTSYKGWDQKLYPQYKHEEVLVDPLTATPTQIRLEGNIGSVGESTWKPSFSPDLNGCRLIHRQSQPQKET